MTGSASNSQKTAFAEAKALLAIESADLGTYEINLVTDNMTTSDRFEKIWGIGHGHTRKEIVARIHPDDRLLREKSHTESIKTGNLDYEARVIWEDGSEHWVKVKGKVLYDNSGSPTILLGVVRDISEQKSFEKQLTNLVEEKLYELKKQNIALQESEEKYHKMIAEVEDYAIISLDKNGIIQNWNKGAEKIKGYTEDEAVGKSFKLFYLPEDRAKELPEKLISQAIKTGKAVQEGLRMRKDGSTFWGSIVITAIHDVDNNVIGFSKVTRDLTERKIAEDKIQEYTRELELQNIELKQFAFVASHDMKEPLRKIMYNNNYLNDAIGHKLNDKEKTALSRSINAAQRMKILIEDILSYSHTAYAQHATEIVDLNVTLDKVLANLKESIDETGTVLTTTSLPILKGITHQLSQLFDNLINNAIKYRDFERPSKISITYSMAPGHEVDNIGKYIAYHKISISDNGIGFESGSTEKIFDLFYRLKDRKEDKGSGIGLSICKKIVQNHDGFLIASSEVGKGSTFHIYLPALTDG